MEKSCHSSGGDSTVTTSSGGTTATATGTTSTSSTSNRAATADAYLKHLNKISHKITKPIRRPSPAAYDHNQNQNQQTHQNPPQLPQLQPPVPQSQPQQQQQQQHQHQPPVYNINKNDFRDVVQRLTGSPAHERFSTPPPIQPPKPPSSRLQRIRPPPLVQISNRPPPVAQISNPPPGMLNYAPPFNVAGGAPGNAGFMAGQRQPLSPLPPFPAVHAAAESPISAYMRFLQTSISSSLPSPRWNNLQPPPPAAFQQQQQQNIPPLPQTSLPLPQFPLLPTSPLPFGCVPSPRSPYGLLSPTLLLSPTGQRGFQQLPLSPTLPVPSPRWKGM